MENTGLIKIINKWLSKQGKSAALDPLFRLVWSNNEIELRHGTFNDFYGNLFIRQVTEVRETKKYPYIRDRWVLERFVPPEQAFCSELPNSINGSYEPFFVFESKSGIYLQPTLKVVEFIVSAANRMQSEKITPQERLNMLERKEDREIADFMDQIDTSPIQNALHMKEAVGYTKEIN